MSCFLFPPDCGPSPLSLPTPISTSYPSLCPAEFSFESRTLERDYMGLRRSCIKPQSIADQNILALVLPTSTLIHKSSLADPSPHDSVLCGSHLKLAPPSSGTNDIDDNDADEGEPLSVNIGWPPISSYRRSTTKALVSVKPPCSIETTTPLIVHEAPLIDKEEATHNNINVDIDEDDDDDDDENHKASTTPMHMNNMKPYIFRKPLHIKVSMDGTPIMRKVDLDTMQGYHHLSLELYKLFRFYKRHFSCEMGVHSCFKDSGNGADFILTYMDRDGDWMLVGNTSWETFTRLARKIRIMKKVK